MQVAGFSLEIFGSLARWVGPLRMQSALLILLEMCTGANLR